MRGMRQELRLPPPDGESQQALRDIADCRLRVLATTHWRNDGRSIVLAPVKAFDFLLAPLDGELDAWIGGDPFRLAPGQAMLVGAGVAHRGVRARGCPAVTACTLHLDLRDAAGAPLLPRWRRPLLRCPPGWAAALARLHAIPEQGLRHRLAAGHLRSLLLAQDDPGRLLAAATPGRLAPLLAALDAACSRPWDEAAIAAAAGVSPAHLRVLFRRELGCTPHRHLVRLRLRLAGDRLHAGATIAAAATAAGFASVRGLRLAFRREFACPPGVWRGRE